MKITLLSLALIAVIGTSARGDISSDIQSLAKAYQNAKDAIRNAPEAERSKLYDDLREQVSAMAFGLAYVPEGSDTIKPDKSDEILLDFVYGAFTADQGHLERVMIHTNDREKAIAAMPDRARCLVGLFPVCRTASGGEVEVHTPAFRERVLLVQYLANAYEHIPDSLVESVRSQMSRWQGEDRIPGLLVLAERGDAAARAEVEQFASKSARGVRKLFRSMIDHARKRDEQKGPSSKPIEPKPGR
jgi:hypothetical protein